MVVVVAAVVVVAGQSSGRVEREKEKGDQKRIQAEVLTCSDY